MIKLLLFLILFSSNSWASLSIVQSAKYDPGEAESSVILTLGSSPTPGNVLIAFAHYSQYSGAKTCTPPSGWTLIDSSTINNNDSLNSYYRIVQNGDGTTYTFTISGVGGTDATSGGIYEISGENTSSPINQHAITTNNSTGFLVTSPSVTPSVLNTLALSDYTMDASGRETSTVASGWTADQIENSSYNGGVQASRNSLTSDTSTAIFNTFGTTDGTNGDTETTILIAPSNIFPNNVSISNAVLNGNSTTLK